MPRTRKLPDGLWKRGDTYYARFRANGRLVRKRLSTVFDTACELLRDLRSRTDKADFDLIDNDYTWDELKKEFLRWARQAVRNPDQYERDLKHIEQYCRVRSIRQVDHAYVYGFREWRFAHGVQVKIKPKKEGDEPTIKRRDVTPRTVNREVGTLNNMLNKAVEWGRIGSNPITDVKPLCHDKPKKERRPLNVAEVESFLANSPAYLRPVWRVFLCTGIRKNELVNMRFEDVDFDARVATVRAGTAKNHKAREIPLDDEVLATIRQLQTEAPFRVPMAGKSEAITARQLKAFSKDHVFVTKANTPWKNNLLPRFYASCRNAGIDDAVPGGAVDIHSLRVTFTTLALEHGAAPKAIQAILGHSTLALTMGVYAKATDRAKRDAVGALPFASVRTPEHVISLQNAHSLRTSSKTETQETTAPLVAAVS